MTTDTKGHAQRWIGLLFICISLLVISLDNTILNVALPTLVRDLSASGSELQWMVDSYVLVFAGLLLTMGAVGDRFGRDALGAGLGLDGWGAQLSPPPTPPRWRGPDGARGRGGGDPDPLDRHRLGNRRHVDPGRF